MLVKEIMSKEPMCCTPDTTLSEIARHMVKYDCGAIPICDGARIVGIVTDRDIVCRAFVRGQHPGSIPVNEVMTTTVATVNDNDSIQRAMSIMAERKVRRLPVVRDGLLVGMLTQADLSEHLPLVEIGALVRKVSTSPRRPVVIA